MIQFKTKYKIFIQKNIHSTESIVFNGIIHSKKIEENIHSTESKVFNGIIHSKKIEENYSKFQFNQLIFGVSLFNKQLFKWYKISWIKLILIVAAI